MEVRPGVRGGTAGRTRSWFDVERMLRRANCPEPIIRRQKLRFEREERARRIKEVEDDLRRRGIAV